MKRAIEMLRSVMNTKQVPVDERIERLREIAAETQAESLLAELVLTAECELHKAPFKLKKCRRMTS